jgi:glycosyltransferase involved in cell wall biosynthesis
MSAPGDRPRPVMVTVLVMTCNHERFIAGALDSVLAQETDFDFEILISEDLSTDRTRQIVLDYQGRHPERIRLLLSEHNLHSNEVVARGLRAARGAYIALLDGDDYWTSPDKLQKQVRFLESHPRCSMCFHNARVVDERGVLPPRDWTPAGHPEISTLEEIWMGNFIATCSVMYRNGVLEEIPDWYIPLFPITDWPLHILHAERGEIGYLDEVMGVYRYHPGGLYSSLDEAAKLDATARFYTYMGQKLGGRHTALIRRANFRYFVDWAREYEQRGELETARACLRRSVRGWRGGGARHLREWGALWFRLHSRGRPGAVDSSARRAVIPPVAPEVERPLWSVMIPTYNCANYLAETIASVLVQDPGPARMQIEVIDDASGDDPRAVVEEAGGGRVEFFQQSANVGHIRNFATCLTRSRGTLVHLLHGDDTVRPGFYRAMERAFAARPEIGAAFCRQIFVDSRGQCLSLSPLEREESGVLEDGLVRLALEQRIMTPSIVVRREVYERLGGFDSRLVCSEDWEMWVRIAAHYPVWYEIEPLAAYRMHEDSNTGRHLRSAADMRYTREAIRIFAGYLPPRLAPKVSRAARRTYALAALRTAGDLRARGDLRGTVNQAKEALRLSRAPGVVARAGVLAARLASSGLRPGGKA